MRVGETKYPTIYVKAPNPYESIPVPKRTISAFSAGTRAGIRKEPPLIKKKNPLLDRLIDAPLFPDEINECSDEYIPTTAQQKEKWIAYFMGPKIEFNTADLIQGWMAKRAYKLANRKPSNHLECVPLDGLMSGRGWNEKLYGMFQSERFRQGAILIAALNLGILVA